MPLTVNVGLSRKSSENYQSRGVSINVTAELDQSLLGEPRRLQQQVAGLYEQAERALSDQLNGDEHADHDHRSGADRRTNGAGGGNQRSNFRPATNSQLRALRAICDRLHTNLDDECHDEFGCQSSELDIRQASQLIDLLKERQRADNGGSGSGNGKRSRPRAGSRSGGRG